MRSHASVSSFLLQGMKKGGSRGRGRCIVGIQGCRAARGMSNCLAEAMHNASLIAHPYLLSMLMAPELGVVTLTVTVFFSPRVPVVLSTAAVSRVASSVTTEPAYLAFWFCRLLGSRQ